MLAIGEPAVEGKTAGELTRELAELGAALMADALARLDDIDPVPQPAEGVTYASKIDKHEARLDFTRTAADAERQVRAFNPAPGAFFDHAGERIKMHAAEVAGGAGPPGTVLDERLTIACGDGALRPLALQRAGRGVMTPDQLLRGFPIPPGTWLA
jgi:methionyl-tRNA formyltransferase